MLLTQGPKIPLRLLMFVPYQDLLNRLPPPKKRLWIKIFVSNNQFQSLAWLQTNGKNNEMMSNLCVKANCKDMI